jgi:hypothetical protein
MHMIQYKMIKYITISDVLFNHPQLLVIINSQVKIVNISQLSTI